MKIVQDDKGNEILLKTAQLFMRFGIKSMTLDDVARQLGISKKTLYIYVADKNDLVKKVMMGIVEHEKIQSDNSCKAHENAIDILFALSKDVSQKFGQVHPSINYDLQKYHPEAWQIFNEFQTTFITSCIQQNVELGIKQGLYRDNLDPFLIAKFYSSKLYMCSDGITFQQDQYSFQKIYLEMMRYHIRGIASEEGLAYLKEKVKQENHQL